VAGTLRAASFFSSSRMRALRCSVVTAQQSIFRAVGVHLQSLQQQRSPQTGQLPTVLSLPSFFAGCVFGGFASHGRWLLVSSICARDGLAETIAHLQFSQVQRGSMRPFSQRHVEPQEHSGLAAVRAGPSSHGLARAGDARNRIKNKRMMHLIAEGWTTTGATEQGTPGILRTRTPRLWR
jgi:hypothetical protein